MANLVVAGVCNLACAYCFAPPKTMFTAGNHRGGKKSAYLSLEAFEQRLDFLDRSGLQEARLIGGEPTLHPQFPALIRLARQRGKRILVFTHGLIPEPALACLESTPQDECSVLVNMNASRAGQGLKPFEEARRIEVLRRLGGRALPGFTIYRPDFRLDWLLEIIQETGCRKAIRLGLAQPTLSGNNEYLHPRQYPFVGRKIAFLAEQALQANIRLEFDCGFVRCMFSEADLALLQQANAEVGYHCSPIVDIGLDEQALYCFPLAEKIQIPWTAAAHSGELWEALAGKAQPYRATGIYTKCSVCIHKKDNECASGCLAHTLRRFRRTTNRVLVPADLFEAPVA